MSETEENNDTEAAEAAAEEADAAPASDSVVPVEDPALGGIVAKNTFVASMITAVVFCLLSFLYATN